MENSKSILIIGFLLLVMAVGVEAETRTAEYNFTTETNIIAIDCDFASNSNPTPPTLSFPTCFVGQTTQTTNAALDSSDDSRVSTGSLGGQEIMFIYFNATIQEEKTSITKINWTWEGFNGFDYASISGYFWNYTSGTYKPFFYRYGDESSDTVRSNATTAISNFVSDEGYATLLVWWVTADSRNFNKYLYTDFVSLEVTYTVNAPNVTTPVISPSSAYKTTPLIANTTYTDADNDQSTVLFKWYNNNVNIYNQSFSSVTNNTVVNSTLSTAYFNKTDVINVSVQATDSADLTSSIFWSSETTILNSVPSIQQSNITTNQTPIYLDSLLLGWCNATDSDSDNIYYHYTWWKNGVVNLTSNTSLFTEGILTNINNLSSGLIHFQNWTLECMANDTSGVSSKLNSTTIMIANKVPVISAATINQTTPTGDDNLTCNTTGVSDGDGDATTIHYNWFKDGTAQNIDEVILGMGNTTTGEIWKCTANVTDGYNYSSTVTSATVSIATGFVTPTINSTNVTTAFTNIISNTTNPTNNNSWVNLSVSYYDSNSGDSHTVYFCKSDSADLTGCLGGQFCASSPNAALHWTYTCRYNVSLETATSKDYWVYIIDSSGQISSSTKSTFYLNYPPTKPIITAPATNDTWITTNHTLLQYTSSDPDSDSITYYVYGDVTTSPTNLINYSTTASFNWTELNQTNYYIRVLANDSHGYESTYSLDVYFKVDSVAPTLTSDAVTYTSLYTDESNFVWVDCSDNNSGVNLVDYNITTPISTTTWESMALYSDLYKDTYIPLGTAGVYSIDYFRCTDVAGNIGYYDSSLTFTTLSRSASPSGGETQPPTIPQLEVTEAMSITGAICGDGICGEGENPASCLRDCALPIDDIFTCIFDRERCTNTGTWFATLLIYTIIISIIYFVFVSEYKKKKTKRSQK